MRELRFKAIHPVHGVSEPFSLYANQGWVNFSASPAQGSKFVCCITTPGIKFIQYTGTNDKNDNENQEI